MDKSLITVLIGIFGALLGVYFKELVSLGFRRKQIANLLFSFIYEWDYILLKDETWATMSSLGKKFYEDEKLSASEKDLSDNLKKQNLIFSILLKALSGDDDKANDLIEKILKDVKKDSEKEYELKIKYLITMEDSIEEYLVCKEEASLLSWEIAYYSQDLRAHLSLMIHKTHLLYVVCREGDINQKDKIADYIISIIKEISSSRIAIEHLKDHVSKIMDKNIIKLMFKI